MSSEIDQLYKICCVLGKPDWTTFPEAKSISRIMGISHTEVIKILKKVLINKLKEY